MSNYSDITLVSDDSFSSLHSSSNTHAHFRNYLDCDLDFDNAEVAVKKFTFPNYFHNINSTNNMVFVSLYPSYTIHNKVRVYGENDIGEPITERTVADQPLNKFALPECKCDTVNELIEMINTEGDRNISWWRDTASRAKHRKVLASTATLYYKPKYVMPREVKLYLHYEILQLLGYDNLIKDASKYRHLRQNGIPDTHYLLPDDVAFDGQSLRRPDFHRTQPTLLITSDIARSTRVYGHEMQPILLEKATANITDDVCEYSPTHLTFLPLRQSTISSIEVYIKTRDGNLAPFVYGPVLIELVIRDRQTTHDQL